MTAPLNQTNHVVVVGAGLAGWRFAEALREQGFTGSISLVGAETHEPYDRPPLSKQVLSGKWESAKTALVSADRLADLAITSHLGSPATSLDAASATVGLDNGTTVSGSHVVVATGCRARTLPFSAGDHVLTIRSVDDAERALATVASQEPEARVVVIGGGFIGAEIATSLRAHGLAPLVLEALERPLQSVVGEEVAGWLEGLPAAAGVELRGSQDVRDVSYESDLFTVHLGDGSTITTPLVFVGVGAEANTAWLDGAGLEVRNGLVVDEYLLASENVGAIGDVARFTWRHDPFVDELRIEHWQTANDHARALAGILAHGSDAAGPLRMVPYFWSDQYGKKIQMLGHPAPSDDVTLVAGSPQEAKWLAVYSRGEVVTGLLGLNQPRGLMLSRELVERHEPLDVALSSAPWRA